MHNDVLKYRFDRLEEKMDHFDIKLDVFQRELTKLKVKASLWGIGSGGLAALIVVLAKVLS